jgi:catechol 2,3-dioxygenase-like lactoylglutathione lyase family enzyme
LRIIILTCWTWRKSIKFYQEALGLEVVREKKTPDFTLAYLGDKQTPHQLELTWLKDRKKPYDLGENEFHLAFATKDFAGAYALHQADGLHLLRESGHGHLLHYRSGRLLAGDCPRQIKTRIKKRHASLYEYSLRAVFILGPARCQA